MNTIILASGSEGRKELFQKYFNNNFEIHTTGVSEDDLFSLPPKKMVEELAKRKSSAIAYQYPEDFVCAFDTTVSCENINLGKPKSIEEAKEMLFFLNNKIQVVWTGYSIEYKHIKKSGTAYAELVLSMSEQEIERYILKYPVLNFAGAYAIQKEDTNITIISGTMDVIIGAPMDIVLAFIKSMLCPQK